MHFGFYRIEKRTHRDAKPNDVERGHPCPHEREARTNTERASRSCGRDARGP